MSPFSDEEATISPMRLRKIYKERQAEHDRKEAEIQRRQRSEREIEEYSSHPNPWKSEMESVAKIIDLCQSLHGKSYQSDLSVDDLTDLMNLRRSLINALKQMKLPELIFSCENEMKDGEKLIDKVRDDGFDKDVVAPVQFSSNPYINYIKKSEFEVQTQQRLLLDALNLSAFSSRLPSEYTDNLNGVIYAAKRKLWSALGIQMPFKSVDGSRPKVSHTWVKLKTSSPSKITSTSSDIGSNESQNLNSSLETSSVVSHRTAQLFQTLDDGEVKSSSVDVVVTGRKHRIDGEIEMGVKRICR